MRIVIFPVVLLAVALAGCATQPQLPQASKEDAAASCEQLFEAMDEAAAHAGVRDGGYAPVAGFPYLRSNRFLASFRDESMSEAQLATWLGLMKDLDVQARSLEFANLPEDYLDRFEFQSLSGSDTAARIRQCADQLVQRDMGDRNKIAAIREAVMFPDEYQDWKRVVGLYPLTAHAFLKGVSDYQAQTRAVFDTPLDRLPVDGELVRYWPPQTSASRADELVSMLERARQNPLQIPLPDDTDLKRLFSIYAPVLEIDQVNRSDQIGVPFWDADDKPDVDVNQPKVLLRIAHTRYGDETLLQLVYSFWFPERPRTSGLDLLGGVLDGITWRVTLDRDGEPLLFDTMHNCGCYHMFFPKDALGVKAVTDELEEAILIPAWLGPLGADERFMLRIASGTHYIQDVRVERGTDAEGGQRYAFASDDLLRSLESANGAKKSLFRPDGIVSGTQRGERYLFWPMGIPEPGAMRQWGRHATAFVGRRHFDDPDLIERYFEYLESGRPLSLP